MADTTPAQEQADTSFAHVDDLMQRWHTLTDTEKTQAEVLLADASDKIRSRVTHANDPAWVTAHARLLTRVCCSMVKRALQQQACDVPAGVTQSSEATGPFTSAYTWSNPDGNLWLSKEELQDLGLGLQQAYAITLNNPEQAHGTR